MTRYAFLAIAVILAIGLLAAGQSTLAVALDVLVGAFLVWAWREEIGSFFARVRSRAARRSDPLVRLTLEVERVGVGSTVGLLRWTRSALRNSLAWWATGPDR